MRKEFESKTIEEKTKNFTDLLDAVETQAAISRTSDEYGRAVLDLANATVYAVLKKLGQVSDGRMVDNLKRDVNYGRAINDAIDLYQFSRSLEYDTNGDVISVVVDRTANDAEQVFAGAAYGDGCDLVQAAATAIMEQIERQATIGGEYDLERPYIVRELSKKVWIREPDSAAIIDRETIPIVEVFVAVRRAVRESRSVRMNPRDEFLYGEKVKYDNDGSAHTYYRRQKKGYDLGSYASDIYGRPTGTYTADDNTAERVETLIGQLNLTARQAIILDLRMRGYGYDAIASYLGISRETVRDHRRYIAKKAEKIGLKP